MRVPFRGGYPAFADFLKNWVPIAETKQALYFSLLNSANWLIGLYSGKALLSASYLWFLWANIAMNGHLALNSETSKA
jgi:hypothetical protein